MVKVKTESSDLTRLCRRAKYALILIQLSLGGLLVRLLYIEVLYGDQLRARVNLFSTHTSNTQIKRGKIVDRNGSVLAINRNLISVWADPSFLDTSPERAARQLAPVVGATETELISKLHQKRKKFIWLQRNIPYSQLEDIRFVTRQLRGIQYKVYGKRHYPSNELACHVIGATNFEGLGIEGIERQYDRQLSPLDNATIVNETDNIVADATYPVEDNNSTILSPIEAEDRGHTIILTVDGYIQHIVEQALLEGCKKWRSPTGTAVVMHTKSGEILAMANYPNYNLNHYAQSPESYKRNMAIWMQYEPGSVFKIVTACGVINEQISTADSMEYCEMGPYYLENGHTIKDVKPNGWLTLSQIIQKSSNIGIVKTAQKLGHKSITHYVEAFGFGQKTLIDLPFEKKGALRGLRIWDEYAEATVPFGQGISVTPLQMLNTINTIATKGVLMQPYVALGVLTHGNQEIERFHPQPIRRVMSPETATALTEILVQVTERGSGQNAQVDGYRVAGKTGTSQKAVANQGYVKGKVIASFAGFLPAEDPLISIIVVIDEPQGAPLSTQVAAPVFQKIAGQTVRHLTSIANRVADAASFPDSTDHPTFGLIAQSDNY